MPIRAPVLDDRNFEQLLQEAKNKIGSFTPEWTNYAGESDPGITIVELFAFLTENLLYRSNRVPELNRLKFLQLQSVPLRPASPAEGIITILNAWRADGLVIYDAARAQLTLCREDDLRRLVGSR